MAIFEGAGVALVTPFTEEGLINYDKFEELVEEQIAGGTDSIIVCGTTGEASTLTHEEHIRAIQFVIDVTKKRIPVIAGTGSNCTATAQYLSKCAEEAGADGISLINTVLGMRLDLARRKPLLANTTGGLSGPAIFPLAVRMVYQVYEAVSIPIVGMGGVTSAQDVVELMLAGATAVEVGAANLTDPLICQTIIRELPQVMEQYHIGRLEEIIGGAHHG